MNKTKGQELKFKNNKKPDEWVPVLSQSYRGGYSLRSEMYVY